MNSPMLQLSEALDKLAVHPGCPACDGKGFIAVKRYLPTLKLTTLAAPRKCIACSGSGLPRSIAVLKRMP